MVLDKSESVGSFDDNWCESTFLHSAFNFDIFQQETLIE